MSDAAHGQEQAPPSDPKLYLALLAREQSEDAMAPLAALLNAAVGAGLPEAGDGAPPADAAVWAELHASEDAKGSGAFAMTLPAALALAGPALGWADARREEAITSGTLAPDAKEALQKVLTALALAGTSAVRRRVGHKLKLDVKALRLLASGEAPPAVEAPARVTIPFTAAGKPAAVHLLWPGKVAEALVGWAGPKIPAEAAKAQLEAPPKPAAVPPPAKLEILTVDDQHTIRILLKRHLQAAGFNVTEAVDGMDGLEKFKLKRFDAVILDMMMPQMDGLETCRQIRATEAGKTVPIMMCTGKGQRSDVMEAVQAGANDYIVKPFTSEILLMKLRKVMEKKPA